MRAKCMAGTVQKGKSCVKFVAFAVSRTIGQKAVFKEYFQKMTPHVSFFGQFCEKLFI